MITGHTRGEITRQTGVYIKHWLDEIIIQRYSTIIQFLILCYVAQGVIGN